MNSEAWISAFRKDGGAQSQFVIIVTCLVFGSMPIIELIKVHTAHTYAYAFAFALCHHPLPTPSRHVSRRAPTLDTTATPRA